MIREALPRKGLLQVVCVGRAARLAALGRIIARGRWCGRRGPRRGRVGLGCGRRRSGTRGTESGRLLCLELADRATRDRRGRRRCLVGIGDRGRCFVPNVFLHWWTVSLERSWHTGHGTEHTSSAAFLYSLSDSASWAFDESSLGPTEKRRAAATLRMARRTYGVEAHAQVGSTHHRR